jgi:hypothetical protein
MLQKGFFLTDPFNPEPFWDNKVVNLSGNQKFDDNIVFPAGYYKVDVQAGSGGNVDSSGLGRVESRKIIQTFVVNIPFIIKAYCGSRGWGNTTGKNPYSGEFKVNGVASSANIPTVSHIFGNAGSAGDEGFDDGHKYCASGGNCLGNGVKSTAVSTSSGAGSCLHFLPEDGVFGTNYLYAIHVAPGGVGVLASGGGGSAYGGAGSGGASSSTGTGGTSKQGGSTPFGIGGGGVHASPGPTTVKGKNGNGIGAGLGGWGTFSLDPNSPAHGGAAYFDGTNWVDANSNGLFGGKDEDGHIIVEYLGPLV